MRRYFLFLSFLFGVVHLQFGHRCFFLPLLKLCELSRVRFENLFIKVRLARRSFLADLLIGIERNTSQVSANVRVFPHLYLKNILRDILIMYYTDMS